LQDRLGLARAVVVSGGAYGCNYGVLEAALMPFPHRFRGFALMAEDTMGSAREAGWDLARKLTNPAGGRSSWRNPMLS
jgi:hypothetical protein